MKDSQFECPFCHAITWQADKLGFLLNHKRPDGKSCRKAAKAYAKLSPTKHVDCDCVSCRPWTT